MSACQYNYAKFARATMTLLHFHGDDVERFCEVVEATFSIMTPAQRRVVRNRLFQSFGYMADVIFEDAEDTMDYIHECRKQGKRVKDEL
jgi:DNA-binding MltR family transcriptional regulator